MSSKTVKTDQSFRSGKSSQGILEGPLLKSVLFITFILVTMSAPAMISSSDRQTMEMPVEEVLSEVAAHIVEHEIGLGIYRISHALWISLTLPRYDAPGSGSFLDRLYEKDIDRTPEAAIGSYTQAGQQDNRSNSSPVGEEDMFPRFTVKDAANSGLGQVGLVSRKSIIARTCSR